MSSQFHRNRANNSRLRAASSTLVISILALGIFVTGLVAASYFSRLQPLNGANTNPHRSTVVSTIQFSAIEFSFDYHNNIIYAIGEGAHSILQINASSNLAVGQLFLPRNESARSIAYDSANNELYLILGTDPELGNTDLVGMDASSNSIKVDLKFSDAYQLAIDPIRNLVFISSIEFIRNSTSAGIVVLDGRTDQIDERITILNSSLGRCCYLGSLVYDPETNFLYESLGVFDSAGGLKPLSVAVDTLNDTVFGNLSQTFGTADFAYDSRSGAVLQSNNGFFDTGNAFNTTSLVSGSNITVFRGAKSIGAIPVSTSTSKNESIGPIAFDPLSNRIFAAFGQLDSRSGFSPEETSIATIEASSGNTELVTAVPDGVVALFVDPVNLDLYVATPSFVYANSVT